MSTIATTYSPEFIAQRNALSLIVTNAYLKRHKMPPVTRHAAVDEDIANAILHAGWQIPGMGKNAITPTATEEIAQRHSLALIITNAYRARHMMPAVAYHASIDEDIAEDIMQAGWSAPESKPEDPAQPKTDSIAILNEAINTGVGSVTSHRAKHIRELSMQVMDQHSDWTDRSDEHRMFCIYDNASWPCPEFETARTAYLNAGGNPLDVS